eukprot:5359425-Amphidinium_carterae.1
MEVLNRIQSAIRYTQLSNMHHHPEDCPQREKRGWMGDAQITSLQASLNFDTTAFYRQWLQAMRDDQVTGCSTSPGVRGDEDGASACCDPAALTFGCNFKGVTDNFTNSVGSVPDTVPFFKPYGGWPGDPSWGSASVVVPHLLVAVLGEP